jgi:hypothetical protein
MFFFRGAAPAPAEAPRAGQRLFSSSARCPPSPANSFHFVTLSARPKTKKTRARKPFCAKRVH